jgi:endoglucanase Acf2
MLKRFAAGWVVGLVGLSGAAGGQEVVRVGAGGYVTVLPSGVKGPQADIYRTPELKGPMPTNDWWSSLAWMKYSERQYPHPLAVMAQAEGLRVYYPGKTITANKDAIFASMPEKVGDDLILEHSGVEKFPDARVEGFSDWFVTARFSDGTKGMSVTYGHGSPFVYVIFDGGEAKVSFGKGAEVWAGSEKTPVLGVMANGKAYGLFGPGGSTWSGLGSKTLLNHAGGKNYFSLALLPDATEKTLALFAKYAYSHVTGSKVEWSYDAKAAAVTTTFTFATRAYEGDAKGTLFALYPHQWRNAQSPLLDAGYESVRGKMKLGEGESFKTTMRFPGVLPALPDSGALDKTKLASYIKNEADQAMPPVKDTYAEGKWLGKLATLIPIAEQCGADAAATTMRDHLKARLEHWSNPSEQAGGRKSGLFYYDKNWGTLIGYPASYGSDQELNDHHFHYGYFFKAAAEIARHDPAWAADEKWGGMLKMILRDVASADRADPLFPFLRNFDPYAGHSWASGHARFGDGNNNESSSEAMNAWSGIILLGEAIGDKAMRDLGIYLYTTELNGIDEYWFDVHGDNRPATYTPSVVTMVWGGKGANGTWFSNRPPVVHGINFLPVHGGSLYLGLFPQYAEKNYKALVAENKGDSFGEWPDIIWMYHALSDADDAMRLYEAAGDRYRGEGGNTRANTYHWITNLKALGQVDATVTSDSPLYAVFKKGDVRTYVAYNMRDQAMAVTFSDGFVLKANGKGFVTGKR